MALELEGQNILVSSIAGKNDICMVMEDDVIVPDSKPDIGRVLVADGDVFIGNIETDKERIKVTGVVRYKIIYMAEDRNDDTRGITTDVPFTRDINVPGVDKGMDCVGDFLIEHVECAAVNSRKLNLKCFGRFLCKVRKERTFKAVSDLCGEDSVQLLKEDYDLKRFLGSVQESFTVSQELEVPAGNPHVFEILRTDVKIGGVKAEASGGKVIVKGEITVTNLYSTEDDEEERVQHMEHEIPFTQYLELQEIEDDSAINVSTRLQDYKCSVEEDINGELRLLNADVEILVEVDGAEESKIELVSDAYSPAKDIRIVKENVRLEGSGGKGSAKIPVREAVTIGSGLPGVSRVYYVIARPVLSDCAVSDDKLKMEGLVECSVIYRPDGDEMPIYSCNYEIPFRTEMDTEGSRAGDDYDAGISIDHCGYSILSVDELEIRVTINAEAETSRIYEVPVISTVEERELVQEYEKPSMLLYFARGGDTLWSIAKKYRTTVSEILNSNDMEEDGELVSGQQILIP